MAKNDDELRALLDREQVRNIIARVARGEDRRDAALISACFWPDARTDYGIFAGTFDEYLAWVVPGSAAVLLTQHILGQSVVEIDEAGARAETHVTSYHRIDMGSEHRDIVIGGRYLDRFEKRGTEWRIANRVMLYDWLQNWGVAADWSQGLMGTPFSAGHFIGKTTGDYSTTFFAQQ